MTPEPTVAVGTPIALLDGAPRNADGRFDGRSRYFSELFATDVVVNVTVPTLTPVLPSEGCGTAMVVAPGGGFHAHSIDSEGFDVARWLAAHGLAAFVLEYRLVPGGDDPVTEMFTKPPEQTTAAMTTAAPLAGADGIAALAQVRARADEWDVEPGRVGIIGFSAGGNVALRTVLAPDPENRPDFVAAVYAGVRGLDLAAAASDAPPLFALAATDDQLGLADDSVALYQAWKTAGRPAELHLYERGGHGFGMRRNGAPTDAWIERLGDWLGHRGLLDAG